MSESARKRPRVALDGDAERKALQNHPALYYDDGNLILSCGSTLFRVHRSILSSTPPCLHVALEDTKEEIEALLNPHRFPELTVVTFPTLANIFRMATKYRIDPRRPTQAVLRVQQQRQQAPNAAADPNVNAAFLEQEELTVPPATLLAPLFYALSCSTWQFGGPAVGHHIAPLSHADIERFIVGLEQVRTVFSTIATTRPIRDVLGAHAATNCEAGVVAFWQSTLAVLMSSQNAITARRPIEALKDVLTLVRSPGHLAKFGVCAPCAGLIAAHIERERNALWDKLPTLFGLA
ncbi:uncharacterized protein B0H18DRAFT_1046625 [Fomitopsis serialis]|uniref:uncharacterized protein n=1 Tax=Fomitopsis serialis TaxID=139415 RepID=UPI00200747B4|nr:uncharacterized protein B0H18DRAFT_1046625 [Neoantrodia serialis]KAH9914108.1 hypothetical protein B0H18DRAFT_1046625 [Neoantrodia serialis]